MKSEQRQWTWTCLVDPVAQVTKSVCKEVYTAKTIDVKHYEKDNAVSQVTINFHKQLVFS